MAEDRGARRGSTPSIDRVWLVVALATPVIAAFLADVPAADLAYQIRAGELMLRSGDLLRADVFTFTVAGADWLNQQWAAQLILAGVHRVGGWDAIAALYAVLMASAFGLLFLACRAQGASVRASALLTVAGFWVARQNLSMRPQLLGVLLFAVCLLLVARRRSAPRGLLWIAALEVVWVNVHGSFVLAFVLLGLVWLEDHRRDPRVARLAMMAGFLCGLATLVNPFGPRVWAYAVGLSTNPTITSFVTEWAPPTIREYSGIVFFVSVAAVTAFLIRRTPPPSWSQLAWLGAFFALALPALRGVVWWAMASPMVLAAFTSTAPKPPDARRGSPVVDRILIASIVVVVVLAMPWWRGPSAEGGPAFVGQAPQHLVEATRQALEPGSRLFVSQTYASWFEYTLPSMPVFVDSRIELFPTSLWDAYLRVGAGQQGWQDVLDRWQVDAVVINPSQDGELVPFIESDPGWRLVYRDASGSVFART